jgi:hypothetical protein
MDHADLQIRLQNVLKLIVWRLLKEQHLFAKIEFLDFLTIDQ